MPNIKSAPDAQDLVKSTQTVNRQPRTTYRILLLDDDPVFGRLMRRVAGAKGHNLVHVTSLAEFGQVRDLEKFDVVMLDYDLGGIKGSSVAEFIQIFFARVPAVLVSSTSTWWFKSGAEIPNCIKTFIHKETGFEEILAGVIHAAKEHKRAMRDGDYKEHCEPYPEMPLLFNAYRKSMQTAGKVLLASWATLAGKKAA